MEVERFNEELVYPQTGQKQEKLVSKAKLSRNRLDTMSRKSQRSAVTLSKGTRSLRSVKMSHQPSIRSGRSYGKIKTQNAT